MKSIREIYKIGKGPSSSHTMGPARAAKLFKEQYPNADCYRVVLYGSLSKTGVGHGTDRVLREVLSPTPTEVIFSDEVLVGLHSNTMDLIALEGSTQTGTLRIESIGGGDIRVPGQRFTPERKNAPPKFDRQLSYCPHGNYPAGITDAEPRKRAYCCKNSQPAV